MVQKASIIGRVGIRVHPVSDGFRREARRQLTEIRRELGDIGIQMELDARGLAGKARDAVRNAERAAGDIQTDLQVKVDQGAWERAQRQVRDLERHMRVDLGIDKEKADRELQELVDKYNGDNIEFDIQVASLKARLELARVARARNVTLFVTVSKRSMAAAATTLAALSGARLVGDQLDRVWQRIKDLDKSIPMLSLLTSAFLGLAASIGASFSNLSAMVASLAQIFPAFLALPGLAGGFAFGIGAAFAVLKDFNDILPSVSDRFSALQDKMSGRFWKKAKEPISDMIDNLFPQLQKGLLHTADGLGVFFSAFAKGLDNRLDGYLVPMFRNLQLSMGIAAGAADALAGAIATLGRTGSQYLPRLADWFRRNVINFDRWLEQSYNSGALQAWIDRGIDRMYQLWSATADFAAIIYTLGINAERAGGAGLEQFADAMGRVREVVESPAFLNSYRQFIRASHGFFSDVNAGVGGRFGAFMESFVDHMTTAFDNLGFSIGNFLGALYDMLGGDAIGQGWDDLTSGLAGGLDGLAEHLDDIGLGLGALQSIVGTMAERFLPLLGEVFGFLGKVLADNAPEIKQAIIILSDSFSRLIDDLKPVVEKLFPLLLDALIAIAPHAGQLLVLAAGLKALKLAATGLGVLRGAAASIGGLSRALAGGQAAGAAGAGSGFMGFVSNLRAIPANLGSKLSKIFTPLVKAAPALGRFAGIVGLIGAAIKGMWDNSSDFRNGAGRLIDSIAALAGTIANKFVFPRLEAQMQSLSDFWDFLKDFATWVDSWLGPILRNLGDGFGEIFDQISIVFEGLDDLLNGRKVNLSKFDPLKLLGLGGGDGSWLDDFWNIPKDFGKLPKPDGNAIGAWSRWANIDFNRTAGGMKQAAAQAASLRDAVDKGASTFFDLSEGVQDADLSLQDWMDTLREQLSARTMWQSNLDKLKNMGLSDAAYEALAGLGEAGALRVQELVDAGQDGVDDFNDIIRLNLGKSGDIASRALDLPKHVATAIASMNKAASTNTLDLSAWKALGNHAATGFTQGIQGGFKGANMAGQDLGQAASGGTSSAMQIRSPSRVMFNLGAFAAEGWINGIMSLLGGSASAGLALAQSVLSTFTGAGTWLVQSGRDMADGLVRGLNTFLGGSNVGGKVAGSIVTGVKNSGGMYTAGRSLAMDLRQGVYSYTNEGTGRRVGSLIASGLRQGDAYGAGRSLAYSLRKGLYSYNNAGSGAHIASVAVNAMKGFSAYNSGRTIGLTFAKGIASTETNVKKATSNLMNAAKRFFPQSPAKEGPFSGSGWVDKSGLAIGDSFAAGIEANIPKVRMAALAMADAASAVNKFNMNGMNAAISTDNQHVVSLANTPVTFMVDGRPMKAYIREGVDEGLHEEARDLEYSPANTWRS